MITDSYQERLSFAVVGAMLGIVVEPFDRDGRQRAVDAILHYADGRKAALEVSAIGPDREVPIQHYLGQRGYSRTVPGVAGTWVVQLPRTFHPADMRKVAEGLRQCEEQEAMHLSELATAGGDPGQPVRQGVRADLIRSTGARVHFVLFPTAGPVGSSRIGLPDELNVVLHTKRIQSKVEKLAASGLTERHLFLMILPGTFRISVLGTLAFGGRLPDGAPRLPGGLSKVWLLTGVRAGGVVRAVSGEAWRRDDPYTAIDISALWPEARSDVAGWQDFASISVCDCGDFNG